MTYEEIKIQKKFEALNRIRKIYHPKNYDKGFGCSRNLWDNETWAEQRDEQVRRIINELEKDLNQIKQNKRNYERVQQGKI